ncbi:hypothetical protein [Phenylobacterium sp. SCN 70-31]|uniref:hypothetical protein n=1 Tax=Phenylobacterium sp. SCN 70-31 TaxID=1660129 RepID=UPI00086F961C|nr:hypothetical protein [Phenylobacterium sp. SCN 70-31]ODT88133.1 MAG: hypothetical protein ABS78_09585 [Phenylobacterium sp. SCN 70-31]
MSLAAAAAAADVLDLHAAAAEAGVHYDTLRKAWRHWCDPAHPAFCAFPAPFRYPPPGRRGRVVWRRSAVAAWKEGRERAFGLGAQAPDPAQAHVSRQRAAASLTPAVLKQRAALARMMERA